MYTQTRNIWRTIGFFMIANTLGIGAVGAQTVPASAPAQQARKADPRFTMKTPIQEVRGLDTGLVIGPVTGCPIMLVTGCSPGPLFPRIGVFGGKTPAPVKTPLLDSAIRYDR